MLRSLFSVRAIRLALVAAASGLGFSGAIAQAVYRCEAGGKITYTHDPCLGAKVVDTTPTQGMDKWSGQSRKGRDVQASEHNKAMSEAMRPLLNESPEERQKRHRRFKLAPDVKHECARLDARLVEDQAIRKRAFGIEAVQAAEESLLKSRARFRDLRC